MAVAPNLQKLIIPGKNATGAHPGYGTDARTIEQWANEGIVRKLIAGANITLTPSSGIDPGTGIEIAAAGGGGGGPSWSVATVTTGPDGANVNPGFVIPFGYNSAGAGMGIGQTKLDIPSFPSLGATTNIPFTWGVGWFAANSGGGDSITILPIIDIPPWTPNPGTDMTVIATIGAADPSWSNYYVVSSVSHSVTPTGGSYQFTAADFTGGTTWSNSFSDVTLVAGSGLTGNGLVSAAGGTYFGFTQFLFFIPTNVQFVEFS